MNINSKFSLRNFGKIKLYSVPSYLKLTNIVLFLMQPVHKWMVRHIYFPCLRNGIPKVIYLSSEVVKCK